MSEADYTAKQYIRSLEGTNRLTEPAIRQAIEELGIEKGRGLDIPCGIGTHAVWMAERYPELEVEGADFADEHVEYARRLAESTGVDDRVKYVTADMNKLGFADDSFDFVWCCDGLWPGSAEIGCIAEEPYEILAELKRIVKPGGLIAILFWSSQRILPGYPLLEAALNTCPSANVPMTEGKDPQLHFMSARSWLKQAGLNDVRSRTFAADICGPLSDSDKQALLSIARMFWSSAGDDAPAEVAAKYRSITDPDSDKYIFGNPDYSGIVTYTMFSGIVPC